jgi:hypothetical protein
MDYKSYRRFYKTCKRFNIDRKLSFDFKIVHQYLMKLSKLEGIKGSINLLINFPHGIN